MTQADSPVANQPKKKAKKVPRLKAALPRGFQDREPGDLRVQTAMLEEIRAVFERYGFDPIETPAIEFTDALGKFLPDQDRPNEGVFSFQDDDERWLSLRYDLTAPLARYVAQNINEITLPYRTYRAGYVFRNEKPGPGRFRQFMQFDADTVGAPGVQADAEMAMMMADTMEALGLYEGEYAIKVSNRKVLDGLLGAIGLGGEDRALQRLTVLRAIDKLDRLGLEGVRHLLGPGRKDESGDFTTGAGLGNPQIDEILALIEAATLDDDIEAAASIMPTNAEALAVIREMGWADDDFRLGSSLAVNALTASKFLINPLFQAGVDELVRIAEICGAAGYGPDRVRIDPSVVRGLEYYTGPVYEAELLFDVTNEKGETVQFGSVGGGGRYDGLVKRFTGQDVPATGFSIGVSRLMTALKNLGKLGADMIAAPVLVTVMDGDTEALGRYQKFTQDLRQAGLRAEMYQGNWKKFGNQLRYADRRGCPIVVIQGSDERGAGTVQIKDLIEGAKIAAGIDSHEEYKAARPAQVTVPETDLVAEVSRILDHHGISHG